MPNRMARLGARPSLSEIQVMRRSQNMLLRSGACRQWSAGGNVTLACSVTAGRQYQRADGHFSAGA